MMIKNMLKFLLLLCFLAGCGKKVDIKHITGRWQDNNDTHIYYNFIDANNWYCIRDYDSTTIVGGTYQFTNDNTRLILNKEYRGNNQPPDTFDIRLLKKKTMDIRQLGWGRSLELYKLNDY